MGQADGDSTFEIGKLYCDRGDFIKAIKRLNQAVESYLAEEDYEGYLKTTNLLLRIHAERGEQERVQQIKEQLQKLVIDSGMALTSKTYYTLGLCATYDNQLETALDYLRKALAQALSTDSKEDICYAINGIAIVYYKLGQYSEALKEIYNLQVFFQVLDLPELDMSVRFINGHILRALGKHEQALEIFWQCYDVLRATKNLTQYLYLLVGLGKTYMEMNEANLASMYLNLAKKSVDPENMKGLSEVIEADLDKLGRGSDYDLVLNLSTNSAIENRLGQINFKNQFVLLDMLRLFLQNPGTVYSKEALVQKVWKQDYDPQVHDNKIYVTIKRLRKMIEPEFDKPKYIFRAKNGYFLNREARVRLDA